MISNEAVHTTAARLFEAEQTGKQTGLVSLAFPNMNMDDAYRIQSALTDMKIKAGRRKIGWKIGLTSKAMQAALNITTPDSGMLFDDMLFRNGTNIPKKRFIQPRIEAEIAFVMKNDLQDSNISYEKILAATDYICPALEILDTRVFRTDPQTAQLRNIYDTIADNAANAGIVMGEERFSPQNINMRWMGAIVKKNNEVEETGLGAGVLDDPVVSVLWLAQRMADYGKKIEAGDIILSGSFIRPIEATSISRIEADFGHFGKISLTFE